MNKKSNPAMVETLLSLAAVTIFSSNAYCFAETSHFEQRDGQRIDGSDGNVFMEEDTSEPKTAPPRQKIPVDLSRVGVQVDRQGSIVPLINQSGTNVQQPGTALQVYNEAYIPTVNPYASTLTPNSISPWGGTSYGYNPYTTVPSWPGYYPYAGGWPYGQSYYPGMMGGSYNLNLGGRAGLNIGINTGLNGPMLNNSNIVPFGNPVNNFGWIAPWRSYQSTSVIKPLFSPLP